MKLHPTKTTLLRFKPPRDDEPRGTFDFLGFTHHWGKAQLGRWTIQRKTAKSRIRRALSAFRAWCRKHRHLRIADQHATLSRKLRGHYAYFGLTGNLQALKRLRFHVERLWVKWLGRRSQRGRIAWDSAELLLARFPLPQPRIVVR